MKNIILIGMKASGKTTVGQNLSRLLNVEFIELDRRIELLHQQRKGKRFTHREIFSMQGETYFRTLETESLQKIAANENTKNFVLSCGGGTPMSESNRRILKKIGTIVFLKTDKSVLLARIKKDGIPKFFPKNTDTKTSLEEMLKIRLPIYESMADVSIPVIDEQTDQIVDQIIKRIQI